MALKEQGIQQINAPESQLVKAAGNVALRFYQKDRLVTETGPLGDRRVLWTKVSAVAQLDGVSNKQLLQTDLSASILSMGPQRIFYTPYGHRAIDAVAALLGFNGQHPESVSGGYLLGGGKRMFSPTLMRFCSQDALSPFGKGGINAYVYCAGDPINWNDPSGQSRGAFQAQAQAQPRPKRNVQQQVNNRPKRSIVDKKWIGDDPDRIKQRRINSLKESYETKREKFELELNAYDHEVYATETGTYKQTHMTRDEFIHTHNELEKNYYARVRSEESAVAYLNDPKNFPARTPRFWEKNKQKIIYGGFSLLGLAAAATFITISIRKE
jgi:RHS repeat-associated protein